MAFNILRTESESDLAKLLADAESLKPTNFIERGFVDDLAHYTWEMRRYKRVITGIQNNALKKALARILNEILLPPSAAMAVKTWMASQHLSHGWLLDTQSKRQVASLLEEAGLDVSAIEAEANLLVADHVEKATRLHESARKGREQTLRSMAKYRKSWSVLLGQNSDRVLAADQGPLMAGGEEN